MTATASLSASLQRQPRRLLAALAVLATIAATIPPTQAAGQAGTAPAATAVVGEGWG